MRKILRVFPIIVPHVIIAPPHYGIITMTGEGAAEGL